MYILIFKSYAFNTHYHIIIGKNIISPMLPVYLDFGDAEEIGQIMGGN